MRLPAVAISSLQDIAVYSFSIKSFVRTCWVVFKVSMLFYWILFRYPQKFILRTCLSLVTRFEQNITIYRFKNDLKQFILILDSANFNTNFAWTKLVQNFSSTLSLVSFHLSSSLALKMHKLQQQLTECDRSDKLKCFEKLGDLFANENIFRKALDCYQEMVSFFL